MGFNSINMALQGLHERVYAKTLEGTMKPLLLILLAVTQAGAIELERAHKGTGEIVDLWMITCNVGGLGRLGDCPLVAINKESERRVPIIREGTEEELYQSIKDGSFRRDAESRRQRSEKYFVEQSSQVVIFESTLYRTWTVIKGSETFTLTDFISQGRLCAVIGHRWILRADGCPDHTCTICGECRQKIKVKEEVERWEP